MTSSYGILKRDVVRSSWFLVFMWILGVLESILLSLDVSEVASMLPQNIFQVLFARVSLLHIVYFNLLKSFLQVFIGFLISDDYQDSLCLPFGILIEHLLWNALWMEMYVCMCVSVKYNVNSFTSMTRDWVGSGWERSLPKLNQ